METSKVAFTITYRKPGTLPPIFLAGSFSEPSWQAQEMQCVTDNDGEQTFTAQVMVEPGKEYQFKFRAGNTDWWFLDEERSVATDEMGNQNNTLTLPMPSKEDAAPISDPEIAPSQSEDVHPLASAQPSTRDSKSDVDTEDEEDLKTPLFAHESFGAYEFADANDDEDQVNMERENLRQQTRPKSRDCGAPDMDFNDPTLEKFPSDRHSVIDALRTIQTHLDEDRVYLHDPSSPRSMSSRKTSIDSTDESGHSLSVSSPTSSRRRESRYSHSSFGRTRSAVSLGSIEEEPKAADEDREPSPRSQVPIKKTGAVFERPGSPASEDDEIVATVAEVKSDNAAEEISLSQTRSNESNSPPEADEGQKLAGKDTSPTNEKDDVHPEVDENERGADSIENKAGIESLSIPEDTPTPSSVPCVDTKSSLLKETKQPIHLLKVFQAFSNVLFTSRRNTMITVGITAIAIGIGWWKTFDKQVKDPIIV